MSVVIVSIGTFDRDIKPEHLGDGWSTGPLPLSLTTVSGTRRSAAGYRRRTYLDSHAADMVLGEFGKSWRAHRLVAPSGQIEHGVRVWAVELVRLDLGTETRTDPGRSYREVVHKEPKVWYALISHASVDATGQTLARVLTGVRQIKQPPAGSGLGRFSVPSERGVPYSFRILLVTRGDDQTPSLSKAVSSRRPEHWAFCMASATLPRAWADDSLPDFDSDDTYLSQEFANSTFSTLSADWRVGVLRSGAAFIGITADKAAVSDHLWIDRTEAVSRNGFFDSAELYVRTIYADVFLLGLIQRQAVHRLRERVRTESIAPDNVAGVRWIGREVARFKEQYWWDDVSRGGPGDVLLRAFHLQHGLAAIVEKIDSDTKSLVDRVQVDAQRRTTDALAGLSLLALVSLGLAVLAVGTTLLRYWSGWPHNGAMSTWFWLILVFAIAVPVTMSSVLRRLGKHARRRWERWE